MISAKMYPVATSKTTLDLSYTSILTIVFITLKLTHVIHWSWLWVLAPTWIPIGIFLAIAVIAFLVAFAFSLHK